jgi:large repetitive protein
MLEGVSAAWALLTARQTGAIAAKEGRRPPDDGPGNRTKGRGRGGLFAAAVALVASSSLFSAPALAQSQGAAQDRTNCTNFAINTSYNRSMTVTAGQTGTLSIFTGNATGTTGGGTSHSICNWSLTITRQAAQGTGGGAAGAGGGSVSYQANSNANGADSFDVQLRSNYSGQSGFFTVSVNVQGNPAPTVNDVSASTGHNQAVSIPSSTGGSVSSLNVGSAANGTVGVAGFNLVYTPNAGFYGQDQFAYSANGPGGRSADATARVTVAPPSPPTASNGSVNASYNTTTGAFRVNVGGTWNYEYNNVEIVSGPSRGTLTGAGYEWFTYTPNNGWIGADSFTYRVTGPGGASNVATMTVTTSPPPAPTAGNTTMTASYNGGEVSRAMPISGVATEAQGVTPPSNGTYGFFGTTAYYTPRAGFYGSDSFTYRATSPPV